MFLSRRENPAIEHTMAVVYIAATDNAFIDHYWYIKIHHPCQYELCIVHCFCLRRIPRESRHVYEVLLLIFGMLFSNPHVKGLLTVARS